MNAIISATISSYFQMFSKRVLFALICILLFSKIQLVVYYQCCVLIGCATTRLYRMLKPTSSEKRRLWKLKQWRLNRVLLVVSIFLTN